MMIRFSIILMLFYHCHGWSQSTTVHFDKPYYFAGDYAFFAFCGNAVSNGEAMVIIRLQKSKQVIQRHLVKSKDGCGDGYLKLPYDLSSAVYQLSLSLFNTDSRRECSLAIVPVSIYNENELVMLGNLVDHSVPSPLESSVNADQLVSENDSIRFTWKIPQDLVQQVKRISVSVRDYELFVDRSAVHKSLSDTRADSSFISGIPLQGKRSVSNPTGVQNNLLFACNADDLMFSGAKVNMASGEFSFTLDPFYGNREIYLLDYWQSDITVQSLPITSELSVDTSLLVDHHIIAHIRNNSEVRQINLLFHQLNQDVIIDTIAQPDKITPDFIIDVQDYDIKGTMVQLFREILTTLKFRRQGNKQIPKIFYERNGIVKAYSRTPLVIINGKAISQVDLMSTLPLQEIRTIRIYSSYDLLQRLSPIALGGIVEIEMLDKNHYVEDQSLHEALAVQGIQYPIKYPIETNSAPAGPQIGSLLYWNPDESIKGQQMDFVFPSGNAVRDFFVEWTLHFDSTTMSQTFSKVISKKR